MEQKIQMLFMIIMSITSAFHAKMQSLEKSVYFVYANQIPNREKKIERTDNHYYGQYMKALRWQTGRQVSLDGLIINAYSLGQSFQ